MPSFCPVMYKTLSGATVINIRNCTKITTQTSGEVNCASINVYTVNNCISIAYQINHAYLNRMSDHSDRLFSILYCLTTCLDYHNQRLSRLYGFAVAVLREIEM